MNTNNQRILQLVYSCGKSVTGWMSKFSMDRGLRTKGFLGYMDLRTAGIVWGHIAIVFITSEFWTFINLSKLGQQLWLISYYYRFGNVDPLTVYIVYVIAFTVFYCFLSGIFKNKPIWLVPGHILNVIVLCFLMWITVKLFIDSYTREGITYFIYSACMWYISFVMYSLFKEMKEEQSRPRTCADPASVAYVIDTGPQYPNTNTVPQYPTANICPQYASTNAPPQQYPTVNTAPQYPSLKI